MKEFLSILVILGLAALGFLWTAYAYSECQDAGLSTLTCLRMIQ